MVSCYLIVKQTSDKGSRQAGSGNNDDYVIQNWILQKYSIWHKNASGTTLQKTEICKPE